MAPTLALIAIGFSLLMGFTSDSVHESAGWFGCAIWAGAAFVAWCRT